MQNTITQLIADRLNHASLNEKPEVALAMAELLDRINALAPAPDTRVFRILANGQTTLAAGDDVLARLAAAMREPRPTFFLITA
jgi:hypothetical protein